jgi:hypothetical protein
LPSFCTHSVCAAAVTDQMITTGVTSNRLKAILTSRYPNRVEARSRLVPIGATYTLPQLRGFGGRFFELSPVHHTRYIAARV